MADKSRDFHFIVCFVLFCTLFFFFCTCSTIELSSYILTRDCDAVSVKSNWCSLLRLIYFGCGLDRIRLAL